MLTLLITFLRESVAISAELVPQENFSQTSDLNNYKKLYFFTVGFQDGRGWLTVFAVYRFMASPGFYGRSFIFWMFPYKRKSMQMYLLHILALSSFALLSSNCFNLYVYFRLFCQNTISEKPSLIRQEKKTHVTIVVPKIQEAILYGTRRIVLLVHCIIPIVPLSPQNHKMIWITILLRNPALQNLMSPLSVIFLIKSFQDFTLYVNIETFNRKCRSNYEQEMWMCNTSWEMLRIKGWEKSCVLVNISWWIPNLKGRDIKYSITQWKLPRKQSRPRNLILFSTIWNVQQKWIWTLVSFGKKNRRWRFQLFLCTRKQYPVGSIKTCVHPWWIGKVERFSQQNWHRRVS